MTTRLLAAAALLALPATALAQDEPREPKRTRVTIGPQLVPAFPGSKDVVVRPMFDFAQARGDEDYLYEAADESFGFPVLVSDGFEIGTALGFEGERTREKLGAPISRVGFTVEPGVSLRYRIDPAFQVRAEVRKGIGGHRGWIANLGADYTVRDGNEWLFAIGPRLTLADGRYNRAYFGVTPADAAASGLPAFTPGGGVQAVGAEAGFTRQFSRRWGIYTYAKYDRFVGDSGRSPILRDLGSRDQLSGGIGLSYTFGRGL